MEKMIGLFLVVFSSFFFGCSERKVDRKEALASLADKFASSYWQASRYSSYNIVDKTKLHEGCNVYLDYTYGYDCAQLITNLHDYIIETPIEDISFPLVFCVCLTTDPMIKHNFDRPYDFNDNGNLFLHFSEFASRPNDSVDYHDISNSKYVLFIKRGTNDEITVFSTDFACVKNGFQSSGTSSDQHNLALYKCGWRGRYNNNIYFEGYLPLGDRAERFFMDGYMDFFALVTTNNIDPATVVAVSDIDSLKQSHPNDIFSAYVQTNTAVIFFPDKIINYRNRVNRGKEGAL